MTRHIPERYEDGDLVMRRVARETAFTWGAWFDAWAIFFGKYDGRRIIFADEALAERYFEIVKAELKRLGEQFGACEKS